MGTWETGRSEGVRWVREAYLLVGGNIDGVSADPGVVFVVVDELYIGPLLAGQGKVERLEDEDGTEGNQRGVHERRLLDGKQLLGTQLLEGGGAPLQAPSLNACLRTIMPVAKRVKATQSVALQ